MAWLPVGIASPASATAAASTGWAATHTQALAPQLVKATDLGHLAATTPLRLAIGLSVRNQAELHALTKQVMTPGTSEYEHWLKPAQFTARFSPTTSQVNAVTSYLRSQGFTDVKVTSNRLYVSADATAGQAERAFNTTLDRFRQAGHVVYANTTAAQVPARLGGTVLSVLGLNDIVAMHDLLRVNHKATAALQTAGSQPALGGGCTIASYGLCDYTPKDFWKAYDATGTTAGSNSTIAIMAEGDLTQVVKDLRTAEANFGLAQVPYTIVHVGLSSPDTAGADEWDLDTQYSTGMAGKVKELYIYDTTSLTDSDVGLEFNKWASDDLAEGGSASFGECELFPYLDGFMVTNDEAMNEAALQGQTMHASTGDTGGQDCAVAPTNGAPETGIGDVEYPSTSPYIVAVGGTTLFTNADGSYDQELAWYAGGGGVSEVEDSPFWQSCVVPTSPLSTVGYGRGEPDIAMDADANTGADVYVDGTPEVVGGTSLSSPLALGVLARLLTWDGPTLGFVAPRLYDKYPNPTSTSPCTAGEPTPQATPLTTGATYPFHDVYLLGNAAYPATPGWDFPTGLGSYDVAQTMAHICSPRYCPFGQ